jgi:hypothetical protein
MLINSSRKLNKLMNEKLNDMKGKGYGVLVITNILFYFLKLPIYKDL